jgi:hypothetical protein
VNFPARAHSSCAVCRERRDPCIYRFFGPCKFDPEEEGSPQAAEAEAKAEARNKQLTQRQIDQSQLVLLDDQMLAADVEKEELEARLDKLL